MNYKRIHKRSLSCEMCPPFTDVLDVAERRYAASRIPATLIILDSTLCRYTPIIYNVTWPTRRVIRGRKYLTAEVL